MHTPSLLISHNEMRGANDTGRARALCGTITELRRYAGHWWITSTEGWLRITDTHLAAELDKIATRLDTALDDDKCARATLAKHGLELGYPDDLQVPWSRPWT